MSMVNTPSWMILDIFEYLVKAAHDNSKNKGFWDEEEITVHTGSSLSDDFMQVKQRPVNTGEKLMLMVSELAEAFEAHRKGTEDQPCDKNITIIDPNGELSSQCTQCDGHGTTQNEHADSVQCRHCDNGVVTVKGVRRLTNMEEEMADVVIRVLDWCGYKGIDLGRCILAKMAYNATRPYKHNRTC